MLRMIIAYFILVRGLLIRIKIMKPTTARSIVAAVAISPSDSPNTSPQTTSAPTAKTSVSAAGSARSSTFLRKLPSMRAWFGSSASKKPGMPMVNIAIRDTCAGSSGYVMNETTEKTESRSENRFLTRNRLAERSMLLTTRRPSSTTSGMRAKSESSSTTCAACAAASLPDAIATEQSASFIARMSLTPSPVMATVCPAACMARTSFCFCAGVTRPKTV